MNNHPKLEDFSIFISFVQNSEFISIHLRVKAIFLMHIILIFSKKLELIQ